MTPPTLDAIARETGTFLMVAMDQRESLRTMLAEHRPPPVTDEQLVGFKLAVARELGPLASGFLIHRLTASRRWSRGACSRARAG